jgi:hypothetical protein
MGQLWSGIAFGWKSLTSQGAPETGDIPNAMSKPTSIEVRPESLEYAPTAGTKVFLTTSAIDSAGTPHRCCGSL